MNLLVFVERAKEYTDEDISNEKLAEELGFSRVTISNVLNGKHNPSTKLLIAFADYFNCSTDYLLGRIDIPPDRDFKPAKPFSIILRRCLKESHKSEVSLQKDLNLSSSLTYRWLNAILLPNIDHLLALANHFGCSVDYLLGRE